MNNLKKAFPPKAHTCVKELITSERVHFLVLFFLLLLLIIIIIIINIIIGLIKYFA